MKYSIIGEDKYFSDHPEMRTDATDAEIEFYKRIQYLEQLLKSEALLNTSLSRRNNEMEAALREYGLNHLPCCNTIEGAIKCSCGSCETMEKILGES